MAAQQLRRDSGKGDLIHLVELILDRGLVIDAFVRVSAIRIELLTIDLRVVVASVDTFIRYAEAMDRLSKAERDRNQSRGLNNHALQLGPQRLAGALTSDRAIGLGGGARGMPHTVQGAATGPKDLFGHDDELQLKEVTVTN
jgi:gas vesicle structural protein